MREEAMLDRVVLRRIRRVVRHTNLDPDPIDQPLQVLLEQVLAGTVAAATVTQQQDRGCPWVHRTSPTLPPPLDAVTGELAGVVAGAQVHMPIVVLDIVQPVGDHHARSSTGEVMIESLDRLLSIEVA